MVKKSCLQDSPPAAERSSDMLPLRRSAIIAFLPYGKFGELSYIDSCVKRSVKRHCRANLLTPESYMQKAPTNELRRPPKAISKI